MAAPAAKDAKLYRMVTPEHTCPWGLKALDLLKREDPGRSVHWRHRGGFGIQGGLYRRAGVEVRLRWRDSNVPLGAVSLTENLMVGMAIWTALKPPGIWH